VAKTKRPKKSRRREPREKRTNLGKAGFYVAAGKTLALPTLNWLALREASSPSAVAHRAGLLLNFWWTETAKRREQMPWLGEWLYHQPAPAPIEAPTSNELYRRFRRESSIAAVERAAKEAATYGEGTNIDAAKTSMKNVTRIGAHDPHDLDWWLGWLTRGWKPPESVTILTADEVKRLRSAFDYIGICKSADLERKKRDTAGSAYASWFSREVFPANDRGELYAWMRWLFGGAKPESWLIPSERIARVHEQATNAECAKTTVSFQTVYNWKADPLMADLLQKAIAVAEQRRPRAALDDVPEWQALYWKTKASMWAFAQRATEAAIRRRCKGTVLVGECNDFLAAAKLCDCEADARRYLAGASTSTGGVLFHAGGKVAARFFVPTPAMYAFLKTAKRRMGDSRVSTIAAKHPCFELMFLDLVLPSAIGGRQSKYRVMLTGADGGTIAPEPAGDRQAHPPAKDKLSAEDPPPPAAGAPSIATSAYNPEDIAAAIAKCPSKQRKDVVAALVRLHEKCGDDFFPGKTIATEAVRKHNSRFKELLTSMTEKGILAIGPGGRAYSIAPPQ